MVRKGMILAAVIGSAVCLGVSLSAFPQIGLVLFVMSLLFPATPTTFILFQIGLVVLAAAGVLTIMNNNMANLVLG